MEKSYTIILTPDLDEGSYTATIPALPGCVTQGETLQEAAINVQDAIRLYLESSGEVLPEVERESVVLKIEPGLPCIVDGCTRVATVSICDWDKDIHQWIITPMCREHTEGMKAIYR